MMAVLANDVREWKALCRALLQTIDYHGLSLVRIEAVFHVHVFLGASVEREKAGVPVDARVQRAGVVEEYDRADEDDEGCTCEDDDGG
jgi:hypothetical protein